MWKVRSERRKLMIACIQFYCATNSIALKSMFISTCTADRGSCLRGSREVGKGRAISGLTGQYRDMQRER